MSDTDIKRWAETWESAGTALQALRRRELQAMTDDDVRRAIADLFSGTMPAGLPRTNSGLVEQQRLFASLRRRA